MTARPRGGALDGDGTRPRLAALRLLDELDRGVLDTLDDGFARHLEGLSTIDAALAREMALGAVTWERLYDALADRFLRHDPAKPQPPPLRRALRIAAHQLFALDRVPDYAIGAATVDALAAESGPGLTGVANAVIRKLASLRNESRTVEGPLGRVQTRFWPEDLATRYALPDQLVRDLGEDAIGPKLAWLNQRPPLTTRTVPGAPPISGHSIIRRDGPWIWWDDPHEALQGPVAEGRCRVQDRSQGMVAELAVRVARIGQRDLVLDLCAAPGGKTLALAEQGCRVIAADIHTAKVLAMGRDAPRLVQDGTTPALAAAFDLVVVDAPCSNTGVLGRRPEARRRYDVRRRDQLAAMQRGLLAAAASLAAPGGRLIYSTCSLVQHENQAIAHMLDGWRILGEHHSWPDRWQAGGYVCVLIRS